MSTIITHNSIIVEDRFREVINYIPDVIYPGQSTGFKPTFGYGADFELNKFLKMFNKPYPLIWLLYPYLEKHTKTKVTLPSVNFILAVDTKAAMMNQERIEETYKKILIPMYDNFRKVLTRNNIMNVKHEFNVTKFPNYSNDNLDGKENKTTARWDALKVNFNCSINNTCLKQIKI